MGKKFYFRCITNPKAPVLVLDTFWEAEEMMRHPDYERLDENGNVIVSEFSQAEGRIPFGPAKRQTLSLKKSK